MKIYLSGAIRGGRELQKIYEKILEILRNKGHNVLTFHVASKNIQEEELKIEDKEIFLKDINWLNEADCVVAEVSTPSLGVGYEIAHALNRKTPVLALFDKNFAPISAMITGNDSPHLVIKEYSSIAQLENMIGEFINQLTF